MVSMSWLFTFEVSFHRVVVLLDSSFDELFAVFFDLVDHVCRDVLDFVVERITGVVPDPCLACEEVNDTLEVALCADWKHHDERNRTEDVLHLVDDLVEVRTDTVELVDVDDTSDFGLIGVAPVGLGLRLNTAGTTEYTDAAVENLEGTVNFNGEVNVTWSVDDVEAVWVRLVLLLSAWPEASSRSGLNGDTTLLLLFHEVSRCSTVVHFAELVDLTGELEDTLGCGGLTSIHVGEDADISVFGQVCHKPI